MRRWRQTSPALVCTGGDPWEIGIDARQSWRASAVVMRSGLAWSTRKIRGAAWKTVAAGMVLTRSATHGGRIRPGGRVVALKTAAGHSPVHDSARCRRAPNHATQGTAIELPMAL